MPPVSLTITMGQLKVSYRCILVLLYFLLALSCQQRQPPQLAQIFQADFFSELPFIGQVSGKQYYDYTKQFDRQDYKLFGGMEQRSFKFYNQHVQFQVDVNSKLCQTREVEGDLLPLFIPPTPISQFVGEETIGGVTCEKWKVPEYGGYASVDIYAQVINQTAVNSDKQLAVLKKVEFHGQMVTVTTEFSNVVVGPLDPSIYDVSQYPTCKLPSPLVNFRVRGYLKNAMDNQLILSDDVSVTLRQLKTSKTIRAKWDSSTGTYSADGVVAGEYSVSATAGGFISSNKTINVTDSLSQGTTGDLFLSPRLQPGVWRAVLSWNVFPRDLDFYMTMPSGCQVNYRQKRCNSATDGYAELNMDVTNGYGPESITFSPIKGAFKIHVHNYSGELSFVNSHASVKLYNELGFVKEVVVPTSGYDTSFKYWQVLVVSGEEGAASIEVVNKVVGQL